MSFWSDFEKVAKTIAPIVVQFIPGIPDAAKVVLGQLIGHAVTVAEATALTGPEKKANALSVIADGMTGVNAALGSVVLDPAVLTNAVSQGIDATITTINAIQAAHVAVQSAPAPAA